jgi:hypothetical protein
MNQFQQQPVQMPAQPVQQETLSTARMQGQERFLTISAMKRFPTYRLKITTSDVPLLRIGRVHYSQLQWLHRHSSLLMRSIQHRSRHIRFLIRTHITDADVTLDAIADNFISRVSFD